MPALIQSLVNGINPVVGMSRSDLRPGDTVTVSHQGPPANSYAWSLAFTPKNLAGTQSSAVLSGDTASPTPGSFVVDYPGSYLVQEVVDAGLPTQSIQTVRLEFISKLGKLRLNAAGERRDNLGVVPSDAAATGWADRQNYNLGVLEDLIHHSVASGRIIYVDANRGKDNLHAQNDPTVAEGYADFSTIGAAIIAAVSNATYNGGIPPSAFQPIIVAVRPGFYVEDVTFAPFVHVVGFPSAGSSQGDAVDMERSVVIRCANLGAPGGTHTANLPLTGDFVMLSGLVLENVGATTNGLLRKIGLGDLYIHGCTFLQSGGGAPNQGSTISAERGRTFLRQCKLIQLDTFTPSSSAFRVQNAVGNTAHLEITHSKIYGTSLGTVDANRVGDCTARFAHCEFVQTGVNPATFAIHTWAEDLVLEDCSIRTTNVAITAAVAGNPDVAGAQSDLLIRLRQCSLGAPGSYLGVDLNDTGVPGTATLQLGSVEYDEASSVVSVGVVREALTHAKSLFFDDSVSGLGVANVQDAIDAIAGAAGAPANAAYLTLAATGGLSQERVLTPTVGDLVGTDGGANGPYTLALANTAVAPGGSFARANLTVDSKGRITAASTSLTQYVFHRQMPIVLGAPAAVYNEFCVVPFQNFFSFSGGAGAFRAYLNSAYGLAPGSVLIDVLVGPPGAPVSLLAAPVDISATPGGSLLSPTVLAGFYTIAAGQVLVFRVNCTIPVPAGGPLVLSLTGAI